MEYPIYKDVVIIGNGPSAITLSYVLDGNWPYYTGNRSEFLPEFLHYRLLENIEVPLVKQDLYYLSNGLVGRSNNPISLLMDTLQHPGADLGEEEPSLLRWQHHPEGTIDHVVLGQGPPGGAWHKMEGSILTISLGSWMELPNLKIKEWDSKNRDTSQSTASFKQSRATVSMVGKYYSDYVKKQNLEKYFINNFSVNSLQKLENGLWRVVGQSHSGEVKCFHTPRVVLATGNSDMPNRLKIPGETFPWVMHTLSELEMLFKKKSVASSTLLVVGAGLSAADAIIAARFHNMSIVHVFRRSVTDPQLIFNKLPANMYPEYHKVYQMMSRADNEDDCYESYKPYPSHTLEHIFPDGQVVVKSSSGQLRFLKVSYVIILIGMHPNLSFLPDDHIGIHYDEPVNCHFNPVEVDISTYETIHFPGLYAMGPLVGDNFVRFVQGASLGITSHILQQQQEQ